LRLPGDDGLRSPGGGGSREPLGYRVVAFLMYNRRRPVVSLPAASRD